VTLQLDDRRLAMLEEMGIRGVVHLQADADAQPPAVTAPAALARSLPPAPAAQPVAATHAPVTPAMRAAPAARTGQATSPLEGLDWQALQAAVANGTACTAVEGGQGPVFGAGEAPADWMVVGDPPGNAECTEGVPFAGEGGQLLANMLAAVAVRRGKGVFITNVTKYAPPGNRNPDPAELAQAEPFLRRQVELVQPRIILAMGRFAVQALLQTTEPIGKLRGRVHHYNGVPVVVTYHPAYLLRNLPDKAKAWADLCMAQAVVTGV
jgi:uracil-DNA glycosylase family 4